MKQVYWGIRSNWPKQGVREAHLHDLLQPYQYGIDQNYQNFGDMQFGLIGQHPTDGNYIHPFGAKDGLHVAMSHGFDDWLIAHQQVMQRQMLERFPDTQRSWVMTLDIEAWPPCYSLLWGRDGDENKVAEWAAWCNDNMARAIKHGMASRGKTRDQMHAALYTQYAQRVYIASYEIAKATYPNAKVGLYGLPNTYHYFYMNRYSDKYGYDSREAIRTAHNEAFNVMAAADFIAPMMYLWSGANYESNIELTTNRVEEAERVSKMTGKPIIYFTRPVYLKDKQPLSKLDAGLQFTVPLLSPNCAGIILWDDPLTEATFEMYKQHLPGVVVPAIRKGMK